MGHHYARQDYPHTLQLLEAIARGRETTGFERTEDGVVVDWDQLRRQFVKLDSAAVSIAEGVAEFERQGGAGPLTAEIRWAVEATAR